VRDDPPACLVSGRWAALLSLILLCWQQGAQPSFPSTPVSLLNYPPATSGGLMAIANQTNNFAIRFTGAARADDCCMCPECGHMF